MSTSTFPLQHQKQERRYWGLADLYHPTVDFWLQHHNLTYVPFYTSFMNWSIKIATNKRRDEARLKPSELRICHNLRFQKFTNPFELIEILDHFRTHNYQGQAMRGWIKNHADAKQLKSAMFQLWHLLYSRPRGQRQGTPREVDDETELAEDQDDEEEDRGGVQIVADGEEQEGLLGGSPAASMAPEPVSP